MYSNERGSRFNLLDLFIRIVFGALFILILVWLFPKVPNMTPFYSNVFRENIRYMQEAGESYFTKDKLPAEVGDEVKLSLSEMYDKNLIIPFVDEDGNSCNQFESYVSIIKEENQYKLKTNLVCNNESNYTYKILGCYEFCEDNQCQKACTKERITQYQYKKLITSTKKIYSCPSGYRRSGKYCYKTKLIDTTSAVHTTVTTRTDIQDAILVVIDGKKIQLETIKTKIPDTQEKVYVEKITTVTPPTTRTETYSCPSTREETYSCTKYRTEQSCSTSYRTESYSCNCTRYSDSNGNIRTRCSTCTRSVPVESCSSVSVPYTGTCTRTVQTGGTCTRTVTVPGKTDYSCPSSATGSEGSGSSLKCYYYKTVDHGYKYSCPLDATNYEGSGANLKCYKITSGSTYYKCADSTYTLKGSKCYKEISGTHTELKCPSGYKLKGEKCYKYSTTKKKATVRKKTATYYIYKWSTKTSIDGWTKTGKKRIKEGKEICK